MIFVFCIYLIALVSASNDRYIKRCLRSAEPWSISNSPLKLVRSVDTCLARSYKVLPPEDRQPLLDHVQHCLDAMRQLDMSAPEYRNIGSSLTQITSNMGSSIVETQHTIARLTVCASPLRIIARTQIFEEARFDSIIDSFTKNMMDTNDCIREMLDLIKSQTADLEHRMGDYEKAHEAWQGRTSMRHSNADTCRRSLHALMDDISQHIIDKGH